MLINASRALQTFIAQDGIQTLVRLTDAPDREVRINSIWALRNMVFKSEESVRQKVMETLGWETLKRYGGFLVSIFIPLIYSLSPSVTSKTPSLR